MSRPAPHELYYQARDSHGAQGDEAVTAEYHRLLVEHGHFVERPACTCASPYGKRGAHLPGCPRYNDNDRRLPCGWLPGERRYKHLTVLVTGSRDWKHERMLILVLSGLVLAHASDTRDQWEGIEILVGDCPTGADAMTLALCQRLDLPHRLFEADWDGMAAQGKPRTAAGPLRNLEMVAALQAAEGDRLVVAFADDLERSSGTRDCVNAAIGADLPVYQVGKLAREVMPG
jgi:hypothetical protein